MVKFITIFVATALVLAASASAQISAPPVEIHSLDFPFDDKIPGDEGGNEGEFPGGDEGSEEDVEWPELPNTPNQPGEPGQPDWNPNQPGEPGWDPNDPENPWWDPNEPGNPDEDPNEPGNPDEDPNEPGNPDEDPNEPGNPDEDPNEPGNPDEDPNEPGDPDEDPNEPGNPDEDPNEPGEPSDPDQPGEPGDGNGSSDQQSILETHNSYRAKHGASPLTWDDTLAQFGDDWIQRCQMQHSGGKYGENLAAGYKDYKAGIDAWYNENTQYNYNSGGFSGATGHFTQVVWKGSKKVGCAKKFCPGSNWTIYICNYDPPGNVMGRFPENVSPPK